MKMISKGYSLWLIPKGWIYEKFAELIKKLAKEYNAPIFQPHITLLGNVTQSEEEAIKLTQKLVFGQKPFVITLRQIDHEDYHFRALFVKAAITKQLVALHKRAKELFGMKNVQPYMPHLSLLYGNYPVEVKEKIIQEIGTDQTAQFEVRSVFLKKGGEVKEWKTVKEFFF